MRPALPGRLARRLPIVALPLVVPALLSLSSATTAGAQQAPAPRFSRSTGGAARYLHTAHVRRGAGSALAVLGIGTVAAAYVQFTRSGRMGMNGGQAATFIAGTAVGVVGGSRWVASRESFRTAAHWNALAVAENR